MNAPAASGRRKRPQGDAGKIGEPAGICGHHDPSASQRCGGNQEVVGSTRAPRSPGVGEQRSMCARRLEVVVLDRQRGKDRIDEAGPALTMGGVGQFNPYQKFGRGDCGDRHVVFVADDRVETPARALDTHDDRGVEDQPFQGRSSTTRCSRSICSSVAHAGSALCFASSAFTESPLALATGPKAATGCPPRVTTNDWWRCSIASSTSENCLATSVALISFISDQIIRPRCSRRMRAAQPASRKETTGSAGLTPKDRWWR
jgi:hypothetical protein